jgi:homoserine kinase
MRGSRSGATATGAAHVRVPATSANLGPGYDALGLALARYDDVSATVIDSGLEIVAHGEGKATVPQDETHLVVRTLLTTFERLDIAVSGLRLEATNRIPHGRGLGSSAAAICAGVLLARELAPGGRDLLDDDEVLALAGEIEGHPDNVAPCLLGGLTIAWSEGGRARAVRLEPLDSVAPVVFVPPFESSTEAARALLPATVPHRDAVFNGARSALLVAALTSDPSVLLIATEDRLHQPYRAPAMPAAAELVAGLRADGVAAVVSGAGPTVLALAGAPEQRAALIGRTPPGWRAEALDIDRTGAVVTSRGAIVSPIGE